MLILSMLTLCYWANANMLQKKDEQSSDLLVVFNKLVEAEQDAQPS